MIINVVCCFKFVYICTFMCEQLHLNPCSESVLTVTAPQDCFSSRLLCAFNFCVWAAQNYRRVTSLLLLRGIDVIAEMSAWTTCVFITAWAKDHKIKLLLFFYVYAWKKDTVLLNLQIQSPPLNSAGVIDLPPVHFTEDQMFVLMLQSNH